MKKLMAICMGMIFGLSFAIAGKMIVVDLSKQEAIAYENGQPIMRGWVSTGRPGHRTPTGYFRVLEKDLRHVSSKYPRPNGGARMDYMLRLTRSGIAMHLGYVPNYPASHGCIRMENGFAQKMFRWAGVGTRVQIKGTPPSYVSRKRSSIGSLASTTTRTKRRVASSNFNSDEPLSLLSSNPKKVNATTTKRTFKKKKYATKSYKKSRYAKYKTRKSHRYSKKYKKRVYIAEREQMHPLAMLRD